MDIKVIEENPITMLEMKENLDKIEKRDEELNFRSNKTKDYLASLITTKKADLEETRKKIKALDLQRLRERHIVKLLDIMPDDMDSLKIMFAGENLTLSEEDLKRLLDALK
tara:strand:- start:61 stop:393 length:333 start_codon:yes stop_codon:yes gene_type:complete